MARPALRWETAPNHVGCRVSLLLLMCCGGCWRVATLGTTGVPPFREEPIWGWWGQWDAPDHGGAFHQSATASNTTSGPAPWPPPLPADVPEAVLTRGVRAWGLRARGWPALLRKLQIARAPPRDWPRPPLRLVVFGGSVSVLKPAGVARTYLEELVAWLGAAFPGVEVVPINLAQGASFATFAATCLIGGLPRNADLVVIEYSVNAYAGRCDCFNNINTAGYELLLRKVLVTAPRAALLAFAAFDWLTPRGTLRPFGDTNEDRHRAVAHYYDVPLVSTRDAFWHSATTARDGAYIGIGSGGATAQQVAAEGFRFDVRRVMVDHVHCGAEGSKHYAALLAWYIRTAYQQQEQAAGTQQVETVPGPIAQRAEVPSHGPLPPALNEGANLESARAICVSGQRLATIVVSAVGFELRNEGTPKYAKYGYVATEPGAQLLLVMHPGLLAYGAPLSASHRGARLMLGYLKSWRGMGTATVSCHKACVCEDTRIDAHQQQRTSEVHTTRLSLSVTQLSSTCLIQVTVANETLSGEHKFKLTALAMHENSEILNTVYTPVHN